MNNILICQKEIKDLFYIMGSFCSSVKLIVTGVLNCPVSWKKLPREKRNDLFKIQSTYSFQCLKLSDETFGLLLLLVKAFQKKKTSL